MAIYHFHAQTIGRVSGKSSTAAAAYRSGSCIEDSRTGEVHDYTRKGDVIESTILLPEGAPKTFLDRAILWNAVELSEKRKDAQTAREINISLPRELSDAENWQLAKDFVQREFVDKGMIADVAFHRGHGGVDEAQPHMHVMLTTRTVGPAGFGQKAREWNRKELLLAWRERWAETCNERLAELGFDMRIDHRTLEAQGINLEPHHYRNGMVDKRTGEAFAEYIDRAKRNGERLLVNPTIALEAISKQQSTFTHQDIARFVNRNTADAEQFQAVYAKVMASSELVVLVEGKETVRKEGREEGKSKEEEKDRALFQSRGERFTTLELLNIEKELLSMAEHKAQKRHFALQEKTVDRVIEHNPSLSAEQKEAIRHLTQEEDLAAVVGFAGTGKSYMLGMAREAWEAEGYRVQGMALSGIAADSLQAGSDIPSNTIANRLIVWEKGIEQLGRQDILVVDEAGMIGSRQMHSILSKAHEFGAKVVLVGDPEQLQAIDAGASFRAILQKTGFEQLSDIRRQKEEWQKEASRNFGLRKAREGLKAYEAHDHIHSYDTKAAAISGMIEAWDENRCLSPEKTQIMLAYTRAEVKQLNETAREIRHKAGELGQDRVFETEKGERAFAEGDRIYFLKNENKGLRVKNGNLGTIRKIEGEEFTVLLDGTNGAQRAIHFNLKDYNSIDHGYAATVYKAQGISIDKTQLLASRYYDSHSTYVGMTRHRETADIHYSQDEFKDIADLSQKLARKNDKDFSLDYLNPEISEEGERKAPFKEVTLSESLKERLGAEFRKDKERLQKAEERMAERPKEKEQNIASGKAEYSQSKEKVEGGVISKEQEAALMTKLEKALTELRDNIKSEAPVIEVKRESVKELIQKEREKIVMARGIEQLSQQTGLSISMNLESGALGVFRGMHEIAGKSYGLMELSDKKAKLIPETQIESFEKGEKMFLLMYKNKETGKEEMRAVQPKELRTKWRGLEQDDGLDLSR